MTTAEHISDATGALISLSDVEKVYHVGTVDVRALDGVTLEIERGEFLSIMGASGSGKSTLVNIIGCLDVPTSGEYLLDGQPVSEMSANQLADIRSRQVGFVFQTHNLLSRMTALSNVELPMMYGRWDNRRGRAQDAMSAVGLGDRMDHKPTELSGGQQQRVGIARALVKQPNILVADEPTGNLDSSSTQEIISIIADLNREQGITVIIVTHELDIAEQTDRIITLRDGVVISDERTADRKAVDHEEELDDSSLDGELPDASSGMGASLLRGFRRILRASSVSGASSR